MGELNTGAGESAINHREKAGVFQGELDSLREEYQAKGVTITCIDHDADEQSFFKDTMTMTQEGWNPDPDKTPNDVLDEQLETRAKKKLRTALSVSVQAVDSHRAVQDACIDQVKQLASRQGGTITSETSPDVQGNVAKIFALSGMPTPKQEKSHTVFLKITF